MGSVESGPIQSSQVVRFSHRSTSCLISCEGGGEGGREAVGERVREGGKTEVGEGGIEGGGERQEEEEGR